VALLVDNTTTETAHSDLRLGRHGCDRAQGFLLARSMPVVEIDELLGARSSTEAHATVG
jgi:EAL domain-containing protein (putative c-di-GMP-specific phosphodiesterase class I)